MDIYCDRFSVCNSRYLDRGPDTEAHARAKGWHIWRGPTMGGKEQEVHLCPRCIDAGRRLVKRAEVLPNQYPIPQLQIVPPPE